MQANHLLPVWQAVGEFGEFQIWALSWSQIFTHIVWLSESQKLQTICNKNNIWPGKHNIRFFEWPEYRLHIHLNYAIACVCAKIWAKQAWKLQHWNDEMLKIDAFYSSD